MMMIIRHHIRTGREKKKKPIFKNSLSHQKGWDVAAEEEEEKGAAAAAGEGVPPAK